MASSFIVNPVRLKHLAFEMMSKIHARVIYVHACLLENFRNSPLSTNFEAPKITKKVADSFLSESSVLRHQVTSTNSTLFYSSVDSVGTVHVSTVLRKAKTFWEKKILCCSIHFMARYSRYSTSLSTSIQPNRYSVFVHCLMQHTDFLNRLGKIHLLFNQFDGKLHWQ